MEGAAGETRMRLRYPGVCRVCGVELPTTVEAIYERTTKTVRCTSHEPHPLLEAVAVQGANAVVGAAGPPTSAPEVLEPGTAGASARREFERRKAQREKRVRASHPRLGGMILALTGERQSTTAWDIGARGEERLGKGLDRMACDLVRVLHDRRIPHSRANIDHLAVTAGGVYVIDAKKYRGRPHLKVEGGLLRPRVERLLVGSRDCTTLVDGMSKQVGIVRGLLNDDVPVHGVLCFVDADWPLVGGAFTTQGVQVLWPRKLYPQLQEHGPLTVEVVAEVIRRLAHALPAA